jgi:integrase
MQKLTEAEVAALPVDGRDRIVFDTMLSGFAVRVTPAGRKIFLVQASGGGRSRKVSIGQHPDMTVADARREARSALDAIRAGKDPAGERTARLAAHAAGAVTVSELADRWLAEYVRPKLKPRTIADYVKLIDQKIKPRLGHMPVSKVAKSDVVSWHVDMQATPRRANYTVATFRALMTFAEDCGLRPVHSNPARKIKMFRESARERFLSETEIGKAADAIDQAERAGKIGPHAAAGLRLALFSGARSGEITAAQWKHVNFGRRIIRLPDSKTNTPRTVHLSDAAVEVLKTLPRVGPYVIAGAVPGQPFRNLSRSWMVARAFGGLDDVRLHDLRHSFASLAADRGVSLVLIGKLLGHKVAATTQRYAHLARDTVATVNDEIAAAMAAAIEKGAAGTPAPANVVKLKRRRK